MHLLERAEVLRKELEEIEKEKQFFSPHTKALMGRLVHGGDDPEIVVPKMKVRLSSLVKMLEHYKKLTEFTGE